MWRFFLSGLCMVVALIVLFAGATGDLSSVSRLADLWRIGFQRSDSGPVSQPPPEAAVLPAPAPKPPPVLAPAPSFDTAGAAKARADRDALQRQVTDLQAQIADRTREATSIAADREKIKQELEALRQQRQANQPAPTQPWTSQRQGAAVATRPPPTASANPNQPTSPVHPPDALAGPGPSPKQQLISAHQALVSGQPLEARRMLSTAQRQMAFRAVTVDRPEPEGTNWPATWVGRAIRALDFGDTPSALHDIELAIDNS